MKVEQIYTGCLAQGAYYIESKGEVAIIDPLREVQDYIDKAEKDGAQIKYIFETHFHADFVSGHVTLSEKTGAPIIFGPNAKTEYDSISANDNQEFKLGDVTIKVIHTPGHTMESTCFLLLDENGKEHSLFSGDTLFLGDVGRPDLAQKAGSVTMEDLAGILYDSLRTKVMKLSDDTIVYPGHGAGSACGKNMSKETVGTIGEQKAINYALRADMTKEEFIKEVTDGIAAPPAYFPMNVMMNKTGYKSIEEVIKKGSAGLSPEAFEAVANQTEAVMLDVRHQSEFVKAHIPNSIFIGIDGGFAPWVGAMIKDVKQPILIITAEGRLEETITRLSRVGFDNVVGYLEGGFEAWKAEGREVGSIPTISAQDFAELAKKEELHVLDVRKDGEYESSHVANAEHTPLSKVNEFLGSFKTEGTNYTYCGGGYRSVIANSILKSRGIHNVIDILGGFGAIKKTDIEMTDFICPTTLK
ncbi:MAG: MBL fold metallo-hydrolase [Flavobacteriales bacterium]